MHARLTVALTIGALAQAALPIVAQGRPDFSGIWRLVPGESRMIGSGSAPPDDHHLTWLIDHREPDIEVVVTVRNADGSRELPFRCTTDGRECVNELSALNEVRRMSATWEGSALVMSQRAVTPHGGFEARDRVSLSEDGQQLVFERVVTNDRGARPVRMVFRRLGPHPSRRPPPEPLPTVDLPAELARVLRDYERHWQGGRPEALAALFTEEGLVARRGGWIRGTERLQEALTGTSSSLRLRPVAYAMNGDVGHIVGAYGYATEPGVPDRGMFILALRKGHDGRWLIAADLDGSSRP